MTGEGERRFRVLLTADFYDAAGKLRYRDIGLDSLNQETRIDLGRLDESQLEIAPGQIRGANGVIVLAPRVTKSSLSASSDLLAIGRFGVGYDSVDVDACTAADVVLFITPGAVDRPVAEATVGWMIALTHHFRQKDRFVREGAWDKRALMGSELRDKTLGIVGFGGIGKEVVRLLGRFDMKPPLVFDPFIDAAAASKLGVRSVALDELLAQSDLVSIHCPLNEQTRNLIDRRELALMKPTAYLLNTARGGIVNEDALFEALKGGRIAGAALDCFADEPVTAPHRFGALDNVLLAPHSIAWTDELFRDIGRATCQGMIDLLHGRVPRGVVNKAVLDLPSFREKWSRIIGRTIAPPRLP